MTLSLAPRPPLQVPYSNAGQGVYTILTAAELDAFMSLPHHYDKFIVQVRGENEGSPWFGAYFTGLWDPFRL